MYTEIRRFSTEEKEFVNDLIKQAKTGNMEEFQVARLLYKKLNFHGIRCDEKTKRVILYPEAKANSHYSYSTLMNFCDLLKELVDHGYIGVDTIIGNQENIQNPDKQYFWIYNHMTHSVENDILCTNESGVQIVVDVPEIEKFNSNVLFSALKDYVYNKVLYIKPSLQELKDNGFVSIEEKRHRKNVIMQWVAIICAIVFPSLNTIYSSWKGTKVYSEDLKNIDLKMDCLLQECVFQVNTIGCFDSTILNKNYENTNDSVVLELQ